MSQGERVKEIRKELGLSMEKFGDRLGISKSAIANIESGYRNLTKHMAKSICREFDVDYFWLTEGVGEKYVKVPESLIDGIIEKYELNKNDRFIIESYLELDEDDKKTVRNFFINIAKKISEDEE